MYFFRNIIHTWTLLFNLQSHTFHLRCCQKAHSYPLPTSHHIIQSDHNTVLTFISERTVTRFVTHSLKQSWKNSLSLLIQKVHNRHHKMSAYGFDPKSQTTYIRTVLTILQSELQVVLSHESLLKNSSASCVPAAKYISSLWNSRTVFPKKYKLRSSLRCNLPTPYYVTSFKC